MTGPSRTLLWAAGCLTLAALTLPACVGTTEVPLGVRIQCENDSECPKGFHCDVDLGQCALSGGNVPKVESVTSDAPVYAPGSTVLLEVHTDQELLDTPRVILSFQGRTRDASLKEQRDPTSFVFESFIDTDDSEGPVSVSVVIFSVQNNPGRGEFPNLFLVDKTPPALASGQVDIRFNYQGQARLTPEPIVTRAGVSTVILVSLAFSEPLKEPPVLFADAPAIATDPVVFSVYNDQNPFVVMQGAIDATQAQALAQGGAPTVVLTLRGSALDVAGNALDATSGFVPLSGALQLEADVIAPSISTDVWQERRPWGTTAWLPPDVTWVPFHELRGTGVVSEGSGSGHEVLVYAFNGLGPNRLLLGEQSVDPEGSIGRDRLSDWLNDPFELTGDVPDVYLVAVDAAGNEGSPLLVENAEWVASLSRRPGGVSVSNPNAFLVAGEASPRVNDPFAKQATPYDLEAVAYEGGADVATLAGARRWTLREDPPLPSRGASMVYRRASGELLLYGGVTQSGASEGFFAFADNAWRTLSGGSSSPGPRVGAALAYDEARDRMVLFGGSFGPLIDPHNDTWEWDGERWIELTPVGATTGSADHPSVRMLAAAAYDPVRQRVILFGGETKVGDVLVPANDLWAWDGASWTSLDAGGASAPPPRLATGLAYDATRDAVVLYGGYQPTLAATCPEGSTELANPAGWPNCMFGDTWVFDLQAKSWSRSSASSPPAERFDAVMTSALGIPVLFGGCREGTPATRCTQPLNDSWSFSASGWTEDVPPSPPLPRASAAGAFDPHSGSLWVFGGSSVLERNRTEPCDDAVNPFVCPPAATVDAFREGDNWACGCSFTDLWQQMTSGWMRRGGSSEGPLASRLMAAGHHDADDVTVLFGGKVDSGTCDGSSSPKCSSTWLWDGELWSRPSAVQGPSDCEAASTAPCPRTGASLAYREDSGSAELILFGGSGVLGKCDGAAGYCGRTWSLSSDGMGAWQWSDACVGCAPGQIPEAPAPRVDAAMAGLGDTIYLFGGIADKLPGGGCPEGGALFINPNGTPMDACLMQDLWEFNGSAWTQLAPLTPPDPYAYPGGRFASAMAAIPARGVLVLFGGCSEADDTGVCVGDSYGSSNDQTWEYTVGSDSWQKWLQAGPAARFFHTLTADDSRASALLFGGQNQYGARFGDLWEWNGSTWNTIALEGAQPTPRSQHVAVYEKTPHSLLVAGGRDGWAPWELDLSPSVRPAAIFAFDFGAATVPTASLTSITLAVAAEGSGYDTLGTVVAGYNVEVWNRNTAEWEAMLCTAVGSGSRQDCSVVGDPSDYLFVADQHIYVRIIPEAGAGGGPTLAELQVDLAELRVEYVRSGM